MALITPATDPIDWPMLLHKLKMHGYHNKIMSHHVGYSSTGLWFISNGYRTPQRRKARAAMLLFAVKAMGGPEVRACIKKGIDMSKAEDEAKAMIDQVYGKRLVLSDTPKRGNDRAVLVRAQCECGRVDWVRAGRLRNGQADQCRDCRDALLAEGAKQLRLAKQSKEPAPRPEGRTRVSGGWGMIG